VLGTPPALILSQDQTLKFNFERAIIWLSLLCYYCLVFAPYCYGALTLDGLVALVLPPPSSHCGGRNPRAGGARKESCTLYLVFKEPRTPGFFRPVYPHDCVIQLLGFAVRPFWGNLSNLRRLTFPSQPFFRISAKKSLGDFLGHRNALDREHRVNRVFQM
jgi:hypothetical protein